jgi:carotenoid 1,2-hydratase
MNTPESELARFPAFDRPVPDDGYVWWYADGLSDDGRHGIVLIAFVGSVFSPYYAWARRRGHGDPLRYCALNVAIYTRGKNRWAMTERDAHRIERGADFFQVGPSRVHWDGKALVFDINEIAVPIPRRIRGQVRITPDALFDRAYALQQSGAHRWHPVAPCSAITVSLNDPDLQWRGRGYLDSNYGDEPLENGFKHWHWMRAPLADATHVYYVTEPLQGAPVELGLAFGSDGRVESVSMPPSITLPRSAWRIEQTVRSDTTNRVQLVRRLEDAPFYSRSELALHVNGETSIAVHEALSMERFKRGVVQAMLPFRMPRCPW